MGQEGKVIHSLTPVNVAIYVYRPDVRRHDPLKGAFHERPPRTSKSPLFRPEPPGYSNTLISA